MTSPTENKKDAPSSPLTPSMHLEKLLALSLLTPQGDPSDPHCAWGAPSLFWGAPGIGKSARIEAAGAAVGLHAETLYLSTLQPEDLSGIPMPNAKGGATNVGTLPQVQALTALGRGILFLDELTTARPAVQGVGLGVVHARFVAGVRLPGKIRIIGAANPPEEAAGGWNLAPPLANRFLHFDMAAPSREEWAQWLLYGDQNTLPTMLDGEDKVKQEWPSWWPRIRGLVGGFVRSTDHLYKMPEQGNKQRGRAWPSPRSWVAAARAATTASLMGSKDFVFDLMKAAVGEGPVVEYIEWVSKADLPAPEDMLDNGWKPDKRRLDIAVAAYGSAIGYAIGVQDKTERQKRALQAWKLLNIADSAGLLDVAMPPAISLMRAGFGTNSSKEIAAVAKPFIQRLGETGMSNYAGPVK